MRYSCSKDINRIVRRCIQSDWTYRRGGKHGLLSPPGSTLFVVVPGTPGDCRTPQNFERDLRRVCHLAKKQNRDAA
ncbi:hypothetical protein EWH46_08645 [Sphaerotilus sulfidivorans]|jgi:hypothetical protein|uniref:Type II toxin-antitoxin system HicA family toxin n=1 Tax=Sphaerotilus sulfidivorans TaxID=639200 RepID=A0A5C1PZH3_9BURK|nr:hypothetical protein EWH46_08645 [Sphaerotilus sulfidivorans]